MNKKFSTLMALALLAGGASAQYSESNWKWNNTTPQGAYRTFETKSASGVPTDNPALDASGQKMSTGAAWSKDVNLVQEGLWYQLEVFDPTSSEAGYNADLNGLGTSWADVLIQERDYQTGKVYLRSVAKESAPLNASLWQLRYGKEDETTGGHWTLVNKETGLELTFDHSVIANDSVSEMRDGVKTWAWYDFNRTDKKDYTKMYASLHNQSQEEVMYLAFEEDGDASEYGTAENLRKKLKADGMGFSYTLTPLDNKKGKLVKAVVEQMSANDISSVTEALAIKPVLATPFFMTAEQFNTRMDADMKANADSFQFKMNKDVLGTEVFKGWFTAEDNTETTALLKLSDRYFSSENETALQTPMAQKFNLTFNKVGTDEYLLVDTARYYDTSWDAASSAVKFAVKKPANYDGGTAMSKYMKARFYFRATYFPTNDSIVFEPLNAAVQEKDEYDTEKNWRDSKACTTFFQNDFTCANSLLNDQENTVTESKTVSLTVTDVTGENALTVTRDSRNEFKIKTSIDRPFKYLERVTVPSGLYYINLANGDERERAAGMSIVHNMATRLMYDTQAKNQDYSLMPATMWVIKQLGCPEDNTLNKYVQIQNREYPGVVFEGQLYKVTDEEGNEHYRFIDRSAKYMIGYDNTGWIDQYVDGSNNKENKFRVADILDIEEVKADIAYTSTHGYKWIDEDVLNDGVENNFTISWNNAYNDNLILKHVDGENIAVTEDDATIFEIAEATLPTDDGTIENKFGAVLDPVVDFDEDGAVLDTILPQLERKAYLLKVKDANLIDNDQLYLASVRDDDGRYYYKAMKLADMDNYYKKLAVVYLKADQIHYDAEGAVADTAYVFVDINAPKNGLTADELKSWDNYDLKEENGWMKAAVEAGSAMSMIRDNNLEDQPNDVSDAFYFNGNKVNQYINIAADYNVDLNSNIKIYSKLAQNNYLFEDCNDANNVHPAIQDINPDFHYLGIESKGLDVEKRAALYVDEVVKDNVNMQRYLFGVRVDSIADGFICDHSSRIHGYWDDEAIAEDDGEVHFEAYNGYTAGWFLVNLEDSIGSSTNMMHNADLYKFNGYTRLGFVEGIHMVDGDNEYLYVVNPGYELKDLMTIKDNSVTAQAKYTKVGYVLDPAKLAVDANGVGEYVKRHDIAGNVNTNHTFSLRRTASDNEGTTSESEPFLLESYLDGVSQIGSFNGAWVKSENGIPVLAKLDTQAGDHEWDGSTIAERIGQSGVFYFETTTDEATANDEIAISEVKVIAGNGSVTINGAAGKKVVVSNILGQVVANTVITSDNATIAAPQGVVVVAVEGEEAVKAIVK